MKRPFHFFRAVEVRQIQDSELLERPRLPGDIAYLNVTTFDDLTIGDRTIEAFQGLVDSGPPLKGVIFDVRLNHGHSNGNGL